MDLEKFKADRDAALLSLDRPTIEAYMHKYGVVLPSGDDLFWAGVHKARTACTTLPREARLASKAWLTERGFHSLDDGDLKAEEPMGR